jgi:DNA polymerase III gamma/tau subunit
MLIGHQKIISFFEKAHSAGLLHQAYTLVGEHQLGKKTIAKYLAARLLHTDVEHLAVQPDFYYIERRIDEKNRKIKKRY